MAMLCLYFILVNFKQHSYKYTIENKESTYYVDSFSIINDTIVYVNSNKYCVKINPPYTINIKIKSKNYKAIDSILRKNNFNLVN